MPGPLNTERLLGLLQEQRREILTRSNEVRGSRAWDASCERLDRINEQIMRSSMTHGYARRAGVP